MFSKLYRTYKKIEHIKHEIQKDLLELVMFDLKSDTKKK